MFKYTGAIIRILRKLIPKSVLKFIPEPVFLFYHKILGTVSNLYYKKPSRELIVVGVTGTNGKTTTTTLIRDILQSSSIKTGLLGTAEISIGDEITPNDMHGTMGGRGFIQLQLRKMVDKGCKIAIIETTSEGIKYHRHIGIEYDILVFTNLTPEHLESHGGSFEKYKQTKLTIFKNLHKRFKKSTPKTIIVNSDDKYGIEFLRNKADKKITFGVDTGDIKATDIILDKKIVFSIKKKDGGKEIYNIPLLGKFNIYNALGAIAVSRELGVDYEKIKAGIENTKGIPGRMEVIDEGQNFFVLVDYAHEGEGMRNALGALQDFRKNNKLISVVGGVGGGRDRRNRFEIGKIASELSDIVVVTDEDPYKDDPVKIIHDIVFAAKKAGSILGNNLFMEIKRENGIKKALSLAKEGDVVIVTGKGAELTMMVKSGTIPWDERQIVRDILKSGI